MLSELEMKKDIVMTFSGCKVYDYIKFNKKINTQTSFLFIPYFRVKTIGYFSLNFIYLQ
jgi:hypothetical protein